MRNYECVYILAPTLDDTSLKEENEKFNEVVTSRNGSVHSLDSWGKRKLAYPIKKFQEGFYFLMKFSGDNEVLEELNRLFRFDDQVLRHLIVVDENPVPEKKE